MAEEKYVYFPDTHILEDLVGTTALQAEEITRWWNSESVSPMESIQMKESAIDRRSVIQTPSSGAGQVTIVSKPARQAAITASNVLHDVVVPDMNAYKLEKKSSPKRPRQGSHETKSDNGTPSTPSRRKRNASDLDDIRQGSESVSGDHVPDFSDSQHTIASTMRSSQRQSRERRTSTAENKNADSQGYPTTPSKRMRQISSQTLESNHRNIRYVSSGKNADVTESQKKVSDQYYSSIYCFYIMC